MIICSTTQLLLVFSKKWTYGRQAPQCYTKPPQHKNTTHTSAQQEAGKRNSLQGVADIPNTFSRKLRGFHSFYSLCMQHCDLSYSDIPPPPPVLLSACSIVTSLIPISPPPPPQFFSLHAALWPLLFRYPPPPPVLLSACGFVTSLSYSDIFPLSLPVLLSLHVALWPLSLSFQYFPSLFQFMFSLSACRFVTSLSYSNVFPFPLSSNSSSLSLCMQLCDLTLIFFCFSPPFSLSLWMQFVTSLSYSEVFPCSLSEFELSVSVCLSLHAALWPLCLLLWGFPRLFCFLWFTSNNNNNNNNIHLSCAHKCSERSHDTY